MYDTFVRHYSFRSHPVSSLNGGQIFPLKNCTNIMSGVAKPQLESRARTEKLRPISGRDLWPRSEFLMYELAVYQFRAIYSNTGVECARLVSQMRVIVKVMIELSSRIVQKNVCVHAFERKSFIPHIASTMFLSSTLFYCHFS